MRVKVFESLDYGWLEKLVNTWLEENEDKVVILSTQFSSAGKSTNIVFSCLITYSTVDKMFKKIGESPVE